MKFIPYIAVLLILTNCSSDRHIFKKTRFRNIENLYLKEAVSYEQKKKSIDKTPNHRISIGKGIYPNEKNFNLAIPKTFHRSDGEDFTLEVEYFYDDNNNVRVILYEWLYANDASFLNEVQTKEKIEAFNDKYLRLSKKLIKRLGEPSEIEDNSKQELEHFRNSMKWTDKEDVNAYLFLLGNDNNFRRIRLAIYDE